MNVDYVRQVAAECDAWITRLASDEKPSAELRGGAISALARAAAVLHTAVIPAPSGRCGDRLPSSAWSDRDYWRSLRAGHTGMHEDQGCSWLTGHTGEATKRQQETTEVDPIEEGLANWERQLLDEEELRQLRAERGRAGEEIIRLQRQLNEARRQNQDMLGRRAPEAEGFRRLWHAAATQRDALVQAARKVLAGDLGAYSDIEELERATDMIATGPVFAGTTADQLRRELWHVLDRMPAGDDDLIESVKKLKADLAEASTSYHGAADAMEAARTERDDFRESWHSTVNQRDALVRAARAHIDGWCGRSTKDLTAAIKTADAPSNWEKQ